MKQKIKILLNNTNFEKFIVTLILLNLGVIILDSMSGFHNTFNNYVRWFEVITIVIFTFEYILRILTIEKISDVFKPMMLVDFFAIAPFYISFISLNTIFLRMFRLSKFLRLLKIGRYSNAMENIKNSFLSKKEELIITFSIFACGILVSAILMYYAEYESQPLVFSSIPKCLYFSIITFTTIGYGDVTPVTALGKIISCVSAIFGVGLHGLFIGIIGTAFISAFKKE